MPPPTSSPSPTRTLLMMRHADAEPGRSGRPDAARELTADGHRRAAAQASVVRAHEPRLVLCSPAVRTRQTLSHLRVEADGGEHATEVVVDEGLYYGSVTDVLLRLAEVDDAVESVLVVAHMPTVAQVVEALVPPADAPRGFRPGDVAVLTLTDSWAGLRPGTATLVRPPS